MRALARRVADRHGAWRSSPRRSCWRCWCEARSPGRWTRSPRRAGASPRATSANASSRAGPGTSAPSRPTSRTCGSASSTNSTRRGSRTRSARRAGRGAAAVQRRTRAVRLRRLPRSAGAAAQGRLVLPAAREAVRRPTRRTRRRVHRVRGRRRQAHAGADQRPADVLPGRPAQRHRTPRSTSTQRWTRRWATSSTAIEESGAEIVRPDAPLPHRRRRPDAADDAVAEPDRQRGEVPARGRRAADRHRVRAERRTHDDGEWLFSVVRQRHRHRRGVRRQGVRHLPASARPRGVQRHGHRSGVVQEDRRAPRRLHLDRHVLHRRAPDSGSHCPLLPRPSPTRSQPPFWKEHTSDISRTRRSTSCWSRTTPATSSSPGKRSSTTRSATTCTSRTTARKAWTSSTGAAPTRTPRGPT